MIPVGSCVIQREALSRVVLMSVTRQPSYAQNRGPERTGDHRSSSPWGKVHLKAQLQKDQRRMLSSNPVRAFPLLLPRLATQQNVLGQLLKEQLTAASPNYHGCGLRRNTRLPCWGPCASQDPAFLRAAAWLAAVGPKNGGLHAYSSCPRIKHFLATPRRLHVS